MLAEGRRGWTAGVDGGVPQGIVEDGQGLSEGSRNGEEWGGTAGNWGK